MTLFKTSTSFPLAFINVECDCRVPFTIFQEIDGWGDPSAEHVKFTFVPSSTERVFGNLCTDTRGITKIREYSVCKENILDSDHLFFNICKQN